MSIIFISSKIILYLHTNLKQTSAQLAELVDALDSNSSIERCAGSIPALGTRPEKGDYSLLSGFFYFYFTTSTAICYPQTAQS